MKFLPILELLVDLHGLLKLVDNNLVNQIQTLNVLSLTIHDALLPFMKVLG